MIKKGIKKAIHMTGFTVVRNAKPAKNEKVKPSQYSTTNGPMEVPCQKESYFYALNNYVQEGDRVLDVGMGIGYGMNLLSIKAKAVYGVDVDAKAVQYNKKLTFGKNPKVKEVTKYNGYELPYKNNFFDVVTCVDVIEHVEDYHRFIDELLRVSKRVVFLATPNRRPEYTNPDGTPKNHWHLREWSYDEFDEIIRQHKKAKRIEWTVLDGPWEGPFTTKRKAGAKTLVLAPALLKK